MNAAQRARKRWKREKNKRVLDEPAEPADFEPTGHIVWLPTKEAAQAVAGYLRTHAAKDSRTQSGDREVEIEHKPAIPKEGQTILQWKVTATATAAELLDPATFEAFTHLARSNGGEYGGCE